MLRSLFPTITLRILATPTPSLIPRRAALAAPRQPPPGRCFSAQTPTSPAALASFLSSSMAAVTSSPAPEPTLYVDGKWKHSSDGRSRPTINPYDASIITHVDEATASDAAAAIASARAFFDSGAWSSGPHASRASYLSKIADLLQRDKAIIADIEVRDTGKTRAEAETDVDDVTNTFRFYAHEAPKLDQVRSNSGFGIPDNAKSTVTKEAVGVCVLISPWNYPLLQICWKLAPALVTGNCVIIKPSEVTPLSTIYLVKLMLEAGIPAKALQLLTAGGQSVGPTLTESPDVDLVSFTGGLETGKNVIRSSAGSIKRCCVELGGKNPHIVFADVDLDRAIDNVATAVFLHSGQVCSSGARLIVEESIADKLVAGVVELASRIRMGSGADPKSETGPLVSEIHLRKVEAYVEMGRKEGAKLLCGGKRPDRSDPRYSHLPAKGYFFEPTVFDSCNRTMGVVREESFGPVLTVERFRDGDEAEALRLANDTSYGLAVGIQTSDLAKARRIAQKLRHGTIWINTYGPYSAAAPWGGFGASGNGRELGPEGLDEYVETKHTWEDTTPAKMEWFGQTIKKSKL